MENYDVLCVAGEGSYGIVMKCKHKATRKIVAIKKLIDIESDYYVKKMAFREIRILKKLQHHNLVKLLDVFKRKKRFYLVFEYLDRTVLDDLEDNPNGLDEKCIKEYMYQLTCAIDYCHSKNVIHRDIKPENLLVSKTGILKLCDFGFARVLNNSTGYCTEYIATRWYRAPELLVRDRKYGKPVDIWAIGCVFAELFTGEPLFPGDSDIDQLFQISKRLGKLCPRHQQLLTNISRQENTAEFNVDNFETHSMNNVHALHNMFPSWSICSINIVALCLHLDPTKRPSATQLLNHEYFTENNFNQSFLSSFQYKTKRTPQKSPLTIEFESKFNIDQQGSNFSTPRIVSDLPMAVHCGKTLSPLQNTKTIGERSKPSNTALKHDTYKKQSHKMVNVKDVNAELKVHRLVPFNVEHIYATNQCTRAEFPRSPPNNFNWFQFTPRFKNVNDLERIKHCEQEEVNQLPKHDTLQFKKEEGNSAILQKRKVKPLSPSELNLPFLHTVTGTSRSKFNSKFNDNSDEKH